MAASAAGVAAFAAVAGSQVLPPDVESDCAGQVPIVVASDEAAQSDLYSAATLAGVIDTSCIVLAGPRDGEMPPEQVARLDAALADPATEGWLMGGEAAVPAEKVAGRNLKRLDGVDRWHTARLAGAIAADPDGDIAALTEATAPPEDEVGGGMIEVDGTEVRLPPGLDAPCEGQVPIVVAVDAAAQADLYSAATLAGVLDTTCYVLAGARGEPMSDEQRARLEAAESEGWIVGGPAAVPEDKIAGFTLTRQGGEDRWETARIIGATAVEQAAAATSTTTTTERRVVSRPRSSGGGGGSSRVPTRPPVIPTPTTPTTQPSATPFTPTVEVSVPQLDGTSGDNIWANAEFEVTIARATGAHADCSLDTDATVTFTVQADGSVTDDGNVPTELIGTLADGTTNCDYTVTFPAAPADDDTDFDFTVSPDMATEATLNADNATATGAYTVGDVTFVPVVTIDVPSGNDDAAFDVDFARSGGPVSGCSEGANAGDPVTLTYTVSTGGTTAEADAAAEQLVAYPDGETDVCEYAVTFPTNESGGTTLELRAGADTEVTGTDQAASATYGPPVPDGSFAPMIEVEVPQLDGRTASTNIWAGKTFDVVFAQAANADSGCDLGTAQTATFTVQDDGTVTGDSNVPQTLQHTLDDDTTTCEYTVTFPAAPADDDDDFDFGLLPATTTEVTLSETSTTATGTYTVGEITFNPDADITVPAGNAGAAFVVSVSSSDAGCSGGQDAVELTYTVQSDDTVTAAATNQRLVAYPSTATMTSDACTYTVTFPTNEDGGTSLDLVTANPAPDTTLTGTEHVISATYEAAPAPVGPSTFNPSIDLTVPLLDGVDGNNIWAGETFEVAFARASTASTDCDPEDETLTYEVQDDGSVTTDDTVPSAVSSTLADGTACSYTVTFPVALDDTTGGDFDWTMTAPTQTEVTVSGTSPAATGAYTVGTITFVPNVDITVPTGGTHADKQFVDVAFASTQSGCEDGDLTYIVQSDDSVAPAQANSRLVAYPDTAAAASDVCTYTVTFPATEDGGTTLALQSSPAPTLTVSGVSQDASATYDVPLTSDINPSITVSVPPLVGTTPATNIWVDKTFTVTVARATASASIADCDLATSLDLTYTVQADGTTMLTTGTLPATLRDITPGGETCAYSVTYGAFPVDDDTDTFTWTLTPPAADELTTGAASAENAYTASDVTFDPDLSVTVPAGNDGKTINADFTSTDTACSGSDGTPVTLSYAVQAAANTVEPASANAPLIAYPASADETTTVCSYTAAFGATDVVTPPAVATLELATTDDATATGTDQAIAASYAEVFAGMGSITVPDLDGTTTDANLFAGIEFEVTIAQAATPDAACSLGTSAMVTFTVQADGSVTPDATEMPATLVGTTAGGVDCTYTLTFPAAPLDTAGGDFDWTMEPTATAEATLSATSTMASRDYTVGAVTFQPDATVTVPMNTAADTSVIAVFSSTQTGCVGQTHTYTVASTADTTAAAASTNVALVAYPADATSTEDVCTYSVDFSTTETGAATLSLANGSSTTVSGTSQTVTAEYTAPPASGSTFQPNVRVRVPYVDSADSGTDNDWTGTIEVRYRPVANSEPECRAQVETFTIDTAGSLYGGGTASPPGTRVALMDQPQGKSTNCEYTADFVNALTDATLGTAEIQQGDDAAVSAAADQAIVAYAQGSVFFPGISLHVAAVNDVDDPATTGANEDESTLNLFRGTTVAVTVAATGGTTAECTGGGTSFPATHTVADDGTVQFSADGPMLLDVPDGETEGCEYTVTFPADPTEGTPVATAYTLGLLGTGTKVIDAANPNVLREYRRDTATTLTTSVEIVGSDDGVQWDVVVGPVASSHADCSPARTLRLRTGADGAASGDTALSVTLVRRPVGANADGSEDCDYEAVWPTSEVDGTTYGRIAAEATTTTTAIDDSTTTVSASYNLSFAPSASVSVPQLDGVTLDTNIWSGTELTVTFARASGADTGCSLDTDQPVVFTVQADGSVTDDGNVPASLLHTLADGTECSYTVTFPALPAPAANAELTWEVPTAPAAVTLTGTTTSAEGAYTVGAIEFDPDVTITVPVDNDGLAFSVDFTSTDTACSGSDGTAVTLAYAVSGATATTATADSNSDALIAYPAGADETTTVCSYTATFGATETGGTAFMREGSETATVTGTAQTAEVGYAAVFAPSASLSVPDLNGLTAGQNIWHNTEIEVTFSRDTTSEMTAGCSLATSVDVTFTIGAGGAATADATEMPDLLVGTTSADEACGYTMSFSAIPRSIGGGLHWNVIAAPAPAMLTADNPSVSVAYDAGAVTFTPELDISVPPGYALTRIMVSYTGTAGCSGSDGTPGTLSYRVPDPGGRTQLSTSLIAYPADADNSDDLCIYTATFPSTVEVVIGGMGSLTLETTSPAPVTMMSGISRTISATYTGTARATHFIPSVAGRMPDLHGATGNDNLWTDEEVDITIRRADNAHMECSLASPAVVTYVVQTTGSLSLSPAETDLPDELIDTLADGTTTCAYTVEFGALAGSNSDFTWDAAAPANAEISGLATSADGRYGVGTVEFDPDVTITVPEMNALKSFAVAFTSTQTGCSGTGDSPVTLNYAVADSATATTATAASNNPKLIAYPPTAVATTDECIYAIAFPESEDTTSELQLETGADAAVSGTDHEAAATYAPGPMGFVPSITITVPDLDGTTGDNIWSGETFTVEIGRGVGTNDVNCSLPNPLRDVVFTVQADGDVTYDDDRLSSLVGTTGGGVTCEYAVTFPFPPTDTRNVGFDWTFATIGTRVFALTATQPAAFAYALGDSVTFVPDVTINVPTGNGGKMFNVRYTGDVDGCDGTAGTPVTIGHTVANDDATTAAQHTIPRLTAYPADATSSSDFCEYTATFPLNENGGMTLARQSDETASVTRTMPSATATYDVPRMASMFSPSITVTVPQLDGTTSSTNIWATEELDVTFARAGSDPHADCSLGSPTEVTRTYTVGTGGTLTTTDTEPAMLVGETADGTKCTYSVTFETAPMAEANAELRWTLMTPAQATLSDASLADMSATGAYTVGDVTFVPDETITVPSTGHDTKRLSATFTGSRPACTNQTLTFTIGAGGTVTADDTNEALIAYPSGETTMCTYTVAFLANEVGDTTLVLQDGSTTTASHQSQAISADYDVPSMGSTFMPTITVTVPDLDGLTSGTNIWSTTELDVTFARAGSDPHDDCSLGSPTEVTRTYTVGVDGMLTTTDTEPAMLVGETADGTKCTYSVTFEMAPTAEANAELRWTLMTPAQATLSDASMADMSATGAYTLDGDITFVPDVTITVPAGNDGKSITVEFTSSDADCTGQTLTYDVQAAADTIMAAIGNMALVAYPSDAADGDDPCEYTVTFSPNETGGGTTLTLETSTPMPTATITGTDQDASATYTAS